jgi:hypothetical protein
MNFVLLENIFLHQEFHQGPKNIFEQKKVVES